MSKPSLEQRMAAFDLTRTQGWLSLAGLLGLVGSFWVCAILQRPFWYDEVATVIMARLGSLGDVWDALARAADGNPPLYYAAVRSARALLGEEHLSYRLPSLLAVLSAMVGVYVMLTKRVDRLSALLGAAFFATTAIQRYAHEARPYAALVACVTWAAVFWQRAGEARRYCVFLALALAAAISFHYYAVMVWPAFSVAELVVWHRRKQFRWGVWAALAAGMLPLVFFWPLLDAYRTAYAEHYWAKANIGVLIGAFVLLLNVATTWALAFYAILVWMYAIRRKFTRLIPFSGSVLLPLEERVLMVGLFLVPVVTLIFVKLTGGGLTPRYALPMVIGAALMVAHGAARTPALIRGILLGICIIMFLSGHFDSLATVVRGETFERRAAAVDETASILQKSGEQGLPLVVSDGLRFLPLAFYTPEGVPKPHFLLDPEAALRWAKTDSVDLTLTYLHPYDQPLTIQRYEEFRRRHREFLLLEGQGLEDRGPDFDWWAKRLEADGHDLELVHEEKGTRVYRVALREQEASSASR